MLAVTLATLFYRYLSENYIITYLNRSIILMLIFKFYSPSEIGIPITDRDLRRYISSIIAGAQFTYTVKSAYNRDLQGIQRSLYTDDKYILHVWYQNQTNLQVDGQKSFYPEYRCIRHRNKISGLNCILKVGTRATIYIVYNYNMTFFGRRNLPTPKSSRYRWIMGDCSLRSDNNTIAHVNSTRLHKYLFRVLSITLLQGKNRSNLVHANSTDEKSVNSIKQNNILK